MIKHLYHLDYLWSGKPRRTVIIPFFIGDGFEDVAAETKEDSGLFQFRFINGNVLNLYREQVINITPF